MLVKGLMLNDDCLPDKLCTWLSKNGYQCLDILSILPRSQNLLGFPPPHHFITIWIHNPFTRHLSPPSPLFSQTVPKGEQTNHLKGTSYGSGKTRPFLETHRIEKIDCLKCCISQFQIETMLNTINNKLNRTQQEHLQSNYIINEKINYVLYVIKCYFRNRCMHFPSI